MFGELAGGLATRAKRALMNLCFTPPISVFDNLTMFNLHEHEDLPCSPPNLGIHMMKSKHCAGGGGEHVFSRFSTGKVVRLGAGITLVSGPSLISA